ncbi:hypothetical protein [Streptomyces sp. NPDC059788]|uniref:hypothetical protein n=1 Tax=Streptomyces sp. NPDC059788 TaxID=3346948 RepID=UPI003649DFD5
MNHDHGEDNGHTGDNAASFFDRYPPETARWLAELGDEANDKAGDSHYEFRKIWCELIRIALHDGVSHAFVVADQFIAANSPAAKYLEERYAKYDEARSAAIVTGPPNGSTTGKTDPPEAPGTDTGQQTGEGKEGQGGGANAGTGTGPGGSAGNDANNIGGGCGGGRTDEGKDQKTGIGQQGTLFFIAYSEWRASIPTRRKEVKTENRRLVGVAKTTKRQIESNDDELKYLDLAEAADAAGLENLVNTYRNARTIAEVLRAAGKAPHDLGLTDEAVQWMDTQLKAA